MLVHAERIQATVSGLIARTAGRLQEAGIEAARLEAELLLAHVLGCGRTDFMCDPGRPVDGAAAERLAGLLERRLGRQPLAYLTGSREFMSLDFMVSAAVLIPRPETEILVENVLMDFGLADRLNAIDIGTGSGCIPVSVICHGRGDIRFTAVDISGPALSVAEANARHHGVDSRIRFMRSDLFAAVPAGERFDVITANLPYITDADFTQLMPEVRNHEPAAALRGGADGLDLVRRCIVEAPARLVPRGRIYLEIGQGQAAATVDLLAGTGALEAVRVIPDYSGIERVVTAVRKETL